MNLDALGLEHGSRIRVTPPRHGDHPAIRVRALGHARETWPHLSTGAQNQEIAANRSERGSQRSRRS
jgi:hypothetical protein